MSKRKIILILVIAVLINSFYVNSTFAWFTDAAVSTHTYEIGDIKYTYSGDLATGQGQQIVVPGQPLISSSNLFITNQSTIETNLRLQIHFTYTDQVTHQVVNEVYTGIGSEMNNFMLVDMPSNWVYSASDQCWHYKYNDDYILPPATDDGYSFDVLNNISFDGGSVGVSLSGAVFKIQLIFQAKQSNFIDWQTLGTQEIQTLVS